MLKHRTTGWRAVVLSAACVAMGCAGDAPAGGPNDAASDARNTSHDMGSPGDSGAWTDAAPAHDGALTPDSTASSGGSGGAYPGNQTRTAIAGGTSFSYDLYLPQAYDPNLAWPLLSVFHGQGDTGANMRDYWAPVAEDNGFIVLATTSTGTSGGWSGSTDLPRYEAALNDALASYNVATSRLYVWGFSAGAHLVHAMALMNADLFAAYAVNAGVLAAYAGTSAPAAAPRTIPVSIRIGDTDPLLPQARQDRDRFKAAGWVEGHGLAYSEFAGGHQLLSGDRELAWDFVSQYEWP